MAQFELKDVEVQSGSERSRPKLVVRVGSRAIVLAAFDTVENADVFDEILTAANKALVDLDDAQF